MRRIAIINQKGGVGKTTTTVNLGAALSIQGRRAVIVDMDAQANLSMALGIEAESGSPTSYSVLMGEKDFGACIRATKLPRLAIVPSNIDLSGAELELASAMGREYLLRDALNEWNAEHQKKHGQPACDYVLFDCPPSLGLLSINALAAAGEVLITLQTEFLALQGMSKLLDVVTLLKKRLNPELVVTGIVPSLYDSRLKLAREVLGEIRSYFKSQVVPHPIRANVKLAEAPSFGQTIFEYAPDSNGAEDYMKLAATILAGETRHSELAHLPAFDATARLPAELTNDPPAQKRIPPPPKRKNAEPVAQLESAPAAPPALSKPSTLTPPVAARKGTAKPVAITPPAAPDSKSKKTRENARPAVQEVAAPQAASRATAQTPPPKSEKLDEKKRPARSAGEKSEKQVISVRAPSKAPHTVRADDIPPLPPDAFEILSTPLDP